MFLFMMALCAMVFWCEQPPGEPQPPFAFFGVVMAAMFVFQMAFTVPSFIAAYGVLKQKSWARTSSIIAAVLSAMSVPVGTAACIYAMWFFLGDRWKSVYPEPMMDANIAPPGLRPANVDSESEFRSQQERDTVYQYREPPDWR